MFKKLLDNNSKYKHLTSAKAVCMLT